jgi:2-polyprenyl-3-methyl-5-hydroxy-6-metoxy-1,4-benzoquinol methylase
VSTLDRQGWDERYRATELVWGAGPNRFLVDEATGLKPGTALDVACGEGRNAIWLAQNGWQVVGVDFSAVGLEKARRLAAESGVTVEWAQGDLTTWEAPNTYDLVIVMYLHLPGDIRHSVFARTAKSVAPGGTMLVVGHDTLNLSKGTGGPQDPAVLYGPEDVVGDIGSVLTIERAERVHRPVSTSEGEATAIDVLVRAHRS